MKSSKFSGLEGKANAPSSHGSYGPEEREQ
jgi:hypothetical protein